MNDSTIVSLREALTYSPENRPLRLLLAETLLTLNRLDEAESEYAILLKVTDDTKVKVGLANLYYTKGAYSACNVILEEMINKGIRDVASFVLYAKGMLKEGEVVKAMDAYQKALEIDPYYQNEELGSRFLQKSTINFGSVGGLENIKREIELKIIKPLLHPGLYKAYGKKVGGGILLYGPPGCGKTYLARATAGQVGAQFISVDLNDILDMWIGKSEKNLHEIFELARKNTPCVLFIDEIDALGASRSDMKQSSGRHLINQFLQELDGINSDNEGVLILGATNTPWNLDPAFRRPGRFDRVFFVPPPDETSRESILRLKLKGKPAEILDYGCIAKKTENYSGADLDAIIDMAIEEKLSSSFMDNIPKPITTQDLLRAAKRHRPSTQEWFMTARNFALFANDSGLYDDILTYMKIKKQND